jgi:hypothetical protein
MDDEISILFCSSMAFRDTLLETAGLADLGPGSGVLFFYFCSFFSGLGMLERPEPIAVWRHWHSLSLRPWKPPLVWRAPRWRGRRRFHPAVYLPVPTLSSQ